MLFAVLLDVIEAEGDDFEDDFDEDFLPVLVFVFVCHNFRFFMPNDIRRN